MIVRIMTVSHARVMIALKKGANSVMVARLGSLTGAEAASSSELDPGSTVP
jgi:hypothetical protein